VCVFAYVFGNACVCGYVCVSLFARIIGYAVVIKCVHKFNFVVVSFFALDLMGRGGNEVSRGGRQIKRVCSHL
jgi:hypothetical protein